MCGAVLHVRCWGGGAGGEVRHSRALKSRSPGAAVVYAGLSGGGCQNAGVFLQIGSDEFFDHKGSIAADMMCPTPYDQ